MKFGKLKRVAVKEFKRSPAKTGFLLLMFPVALYFCVPLLCGAIKKSTPSIDATMAVSDSKRADFVLPAATKKSAMSSQIQPGWVEVASRLKNDLLAIPTALPTNTRNPFAAIRQEKQDESPFVVVADGERVAGPEREVELEKSVELAAVPSNPIRELGLQLNATMVGKRSRLATINGRVYEEGEFIPVNIEASLAPGEPITIQLQLAHVDRRFVVLQMDGHQHRLRLRNEVPKDAIVVKPRPE